MKDVTCSNKDRTYPDPKCITHIGGSYWLHTKWEAINNIKTGRESYCVNVKGHRVMVIVKTSNGNDYLTTEPDHTEENNLLQLPNC